jgi:hypothetical protein
VFDTFTAVCIFCCYLLLLVYLMLCCSISPSKFVFFLLPHLQLNLDTLLLLFSNSVYCIDLGSRKDLSPSFHVLFSTLHLSPLTSYLSPLTSYLSPLTSYLLPLTSYLLPLTSYLLPLTSYLLLLTSHLSPLTSHLSPLTSHTCSPSAIHVHQHNPCSLWHPYFFHLLASCNSRLISPR